MRTGRCCPRYVASGARKTSGTPISNGAWVLVSSCPKATVQVAPSLMRVFSRTRLARLRRRSATSAREPDQETVAMGDRGVEPNEVLCCSHQLGSEVDQFVRQAQMCLAARGTMTARI